jgi:transcriptional regulator GlxA family with amidase domain
VQAGAKVEAVMLSVGIRGKANFYRHFKARFGTTPAEYRVVESGLAIQEMCREGSMASCWL